MSLQIEIAIYFECGEEINEDEVNEALQIIKLNVYRNIENFLIPQKKICFQLLVSDFHKSFPLQEINVIVMKIPSNFKMCFKYWWQIILFTSLTSRICSAQCTINYTTEVKCTSSAR